MKKNNLIHLFIGFAVILQLLSSCSDIPSEVADTLDKAGKNAVELQRVIDHYKSLGDKEKLQAAYFLLRDMKYKYGLYYPNYDFYVNLSHKVDSIRSIMSCQDYLDKFIQEEISQHNITRGKPQIKYDMNVITADYLIENIDLAFEVWRTKPWAKHIDFEEFCEWILPYRVNNEPLQIWRKYFYDKFNKLNVKKGDSSDPKNIAFQINDSLSYIFYSPKLKVMPDYGGIDLSKLKIGVCRHRYLIITMALRSIGIPTTIDFTYQYNSRRDGSHSWTVLLDKDKEIVAFNGGEKKIEFLKPAYCPLGADGAADGILKVTTVFRKKYAMQISSLALKSIKNLPLNFTNPFIEKVTLQYGKNDNTDLKIELNNAVNGGYVYLYTFTKGFNLIAVDYTLINNGYALFKHIGKSGIYFCKKLSNGKLNPYGQAFLIGEKGKPIYINPDIVHQETLKLYRKYPQNVYNTRNHCIQGSNQSDFKKYETLYTLPERVIEFKKIYVHPLKKYRYYRYFSPNGTPDIKIASVKLFYEKEGRIKLVKQKKIFGFMRDTVTCNDEIMKNAFDGDIRTNFNAPSGSWVAVDVGKPVRLTALSVMPRSSFNIVEPGHLYELFYFDKGKWISVGQKVALKNHVVFNNVPSNALYLLRDRTMGVEERRFFYKNGRQIWVAPFDYDKKRNSL